MVTGEHEGSSAGWVLVGRAPRCRVSHAYSRATGLQDVTTRPFTDGGRIKTRVWRTANHVTVEEDSCNVFADVGLPDSDERLVKAELAWLIRQFVRSRNWTQVPAAETPLVGLPCLAGSCELLGLSPVCRGCRRRSVRGCAGVAQDVLFRVWSRQRRLRDSVPAGCR